MTITITATPHIASTALQFKLQRSAATSSDSSVLYFSPDPKGRCVGLIIVVDDDSCCCWLLASTRFAVAVES